jgi:membrane associated rhomboid family serine protease
LWGGGYGKFRHSQGYLTLCAAMLIPYNTDAPLYYPPFATVGTIIVNVLLFIPIFMQEDPYAMEMAFASDPADWEERDPGLDFDVPKVDENGQPIDEAEREEYRKALEEMKADAKRASGQQYGRIGNTTVWRLMTLEFGKFRPWQWLTANYMHVDIFHLLGNMFVLWGFGLVVEGKLGWWRFILTYNLIGIFGWGFVQMIMLFADEGIGLGASLAIFGVLVMALVWAPANEMECIFILGFRVIVFEASIMSIAMFSVFLQIAISALHIIIFTNMGLGLRITSEILHLIGAGLGFAVGVMMLKKNWVDCENWDMFSVWAGKNTKTLQEDREDVTKELEQIKQKEKKKLESAQEKPIVRAGPANQQEVLAAQFRQQVAAGKPLEAWNTFCRGEQECLGWSLPEPDFVGYISSLRNQQLWDHAVGAMQEYLQRYSERETKIRFALAQVLVQQLNRPRDAWQVLNELNEGLLSPQDKAIYDKLRTACKQRAAAAKKSGERRAESGEPEKG